MSTDFGELGISQAQLTVMSQLGYRSLTQIQAQAIPALMQGRDVIGQSQTGSGKTVAFALPILEQLSLSEVGLQAVGLCPTRELSAQVAREFRKLGRHHKGLQVLVLAGGEPIQPQSEALSRGVHVVVGTPGRILDLLGRGALALQAVRTAVLDEADRMLDMGFSDDMEKILRAMPTTRQTALFSATFPDAIAGISRSHQRDALRIIVDAGPEMPEIEELCVEAKVEDKFQALCWSLARHQHESALIFCNLKATISDLCRGLSAAGLSVDALHGDLEQFDRDQVLAKFRNRSVRLLIATDVAARGIDIENLDLVVNFELHSQGEIYQHRIGRTGRAGQTGVAVSIVCPWDEEKLANIERLSGKVMKRVESWTKVDVQELARDAAFATILISGGRKDKIRPGHILGALTGEAGGLSADDVGKIEIHPRLTYVAVSAAVVARAVSSINTGRIKKKRFRATHV